MTYINIHDAKTHLSEHLSKLKPGDKLIVCRRNTPIAEVTAIVQKKLKKRVLGSFADDFSVPDSFDEPLPKELLDAFGS